jgi:hypothetical protein
MSSIVVLKPSSRDEGMRRDLDRRLRMLERRGPTMPGPTAASMLQEIESMSDDELCCCVEQATNVGGIPGVGTMSDFELQQLVDWLDRLIAAEEGKLLIRAYT